MSKIIAHSHDAFFKSWIKDLTLAKEYLKTYLPETWLSRIDLNTLETEEGEYVDSDLSLAQSDQLFKAQIDNQDGYLYLLCDHQSTPDKFMPLRIWHYAVKILYKHIYKKKNKKLVPVLPIVLYTGKAKYNYSLNIWDLFENKELAQESFLKPFPLIDLHRIPDEELKKHVSLGVIEMVFKHAKEKHIIKTIKELLSYFPELEIRIGNNIILSIYQYVINVADIDEPQLANLISESVTPETGEKIMTAAERLRQEGIGIGEKIGFYKGEQVGIQKGEQIGIQKGRFEGILTGKKLFIEKLSQILQARHIPINDVNELTTLLAEELQPIEKEVIY